YLFFLFFLQLATLTLDHRCLFRGEGKMRIRDSNSERPRIISGGKGMEPVIAISQYGRKSSMIGD
ncbi:hypothetical protein DIS09_35170, partial [Burkholderia pseudomallei]